MKENKKENHKPHDPELEKQIEAEIYRRVKEKEEAHKEDQLEDIEERAAVEAIEEFTELPDKEVEQISREVRSEFNAKEQGQLKTRKKVIRFGFIVVSIILLISLITLYFSYQVGDDEDGPDVIPKITYGTTNEISYRAVFTTEVDGYDHPMDAVNKISLDIDRIYLFVTWQNLPPGTHKYRIRVLDGVGSLAWDSFWEFTNDDLTKDTWSHYHPKEAVDKPGRWLFELYIDGIKMFEKFLQVE